MRIYSSLVLSLAVAAVGGQFAAAVHVAGGHADEGRRCGDVSFHWCAAEDGDHAKPCPLCHVGAAGAALDLTASSERVSKFESAVVLPDAAPRSVLPTISGNPRAPPVLPS